MRLAFGFFRESIRNMHSSGPPFLKVLDLNGVKFDARIEAQVNYLPYKDKPGTLREMRCERIVHIFLKWTNRKQAFSWPEENIHERAYV